MPLVVLPLPTEASVEADVRHGLDQALTALHVGREAKGSPEPIYIVPQDPTPWMQEPFASWSTRGIVITPPDAQDADVAFANALRDTLQRACGDVARRSTTGISSCLTVLLLKPLPHLTSPAEVNAHIESFGAIQAQITAAFEALKEHHVAGKAWVTPRLRVVPWTWLRVGGEGGQLPDALFDATDDPKRGTFPIVHDGTLSPWNPHGMARLEAEVLALHALSSSEEITGTIFPLGGEQRRLYGVHSALVEYPYETLRRRRALASFVQCASGIQDHAELAAADGSEVSERAKACIAPSLDALATALRERTLEDDHFQFDGRFVHDPQPNFSWEGPDSLRWPGTLSDERWSIVSPPRRADRLHLDVIRALETCTDRGVQAALEEALSTTRERIRAETRALEEAIRGALSSLSTTDTSPLDVTATALRQAHSRLGALARSDESSTRSAEAALTALRARRSAWLEEEEALLREGRQHPSAGALYLEALAVLLAGLAVTLSVWVLLPVAMVLTAGVLLGGVAILWFRSRAFRGYLERWDTLIRGYRDEANQTAMLLVEGVNARVANARRVALGHLAHAVEAATERFTLELRGFEQLLIDEHGRLDRRATSLAEHAEVWGAVGHVIVLPPGDTAPSDPSARETLRDTVASLLRPTVRLTQPPAQLAVSDHLAAIDTLLGDGELGDSVADAQHALSNALDKLRAGQWGTRHTLGQAVNHQLTTHVIVGSTAAPWAVGLPVEQGLVQHGGPSPTPNQQAVATAAPREVVLLVAFECRILTPPASAPEEVVHDV